ncbi:hypothetical protein DFS34DRAFT_667756 [Phlyctochytrium arcticum]|nr:hypothetical protein DFS34DRAFT_667756 [Phlyctochytrium arcticum]
MFSRNTLLRWGVWWTIGLGWVNGQGPNSVKVLLKPLFDDSTVDEVTHLNTLKTQFVQTTGIDLYIDIQPSQTSELSDYLQVANSAIKGKSSYDIIGLDVSWLEEWPDDFYNLFVWGQDSGATDRISQLAADQFSNIINNDAVNGVLVALPMWTDYGVVYARTDLLAKYNITAPNSLEEIGTACSKIWQPELQTHRSLQCFVSGFQGYDIVELFTEWFTTVSSVPMIKFQRQPALNTPAHRDLLAQIQAWVTNGYISNISLGYSMGQALQTWLDGNAIFFRGHTSMAKKTATAFAAKSLAYTTISGTNAGSAAPIKSIRKGMHLGVSKYGQNGNRSMVLEALFFLTGTTVQQSRAVRFGAPPTLRALYNDTQVCANVPCTTIVNSLISANLPSSNAAPLWIESANAMAPYFEGIMNMTYTPNEGLAAANSGLTDVFNRPPEDSNKNKVATILLAVLIPLALVAAMISAGLCYMKRRKRARAGKGKKADKENTGEMTGVSNPPPVLEIPIDNPNRVPISVRPARRPESLETGGVNAATTAAAVAAGTAAAAATKAAAAAVAGGERRVDTSPQQALMSSGPASGQYHSPSSAERVSADLSDIRSLEKGKGRSRTSSTDGSGPIQKFTVIHPYKPVVGDEMEIRPGEVVSVRLAYDDGYAFGQIEGKDGRAGVFPLACLLPVGLEVGLPSRLESGAMNMAVMQHAPEKVDSLEMLLLSGRITLRGEWTLRKKEARRHPNNALSCSTLLATYIMSGRSRASANSTPVVSSTVSPSVSAVPSPSAVRPPRTSPTPTIPPFPTLIITNPNDGPNSSLDGVAPIPPPPAVSSPVPTPEFPNAGSIFPSLGFPKPTAISDPNGNSVQSSAANTSGGGGFFSTVAPHTLILLICAVAAGAVLFVLLACTAFGCCWGRMRKKKDLKANQARASGKYDSYDRKSNASRAMLEYPKDRKSVAGSDLGSGIDWEGGYGRGSVVQRYEAEDDEKLDSDKSRQSVNIRNLPGAARTGSGKGPYVPSRLKNEISHQLTRNDADDSEDDDDNDGEVDGMRRENQVKLNTDLNAQTQKSQDALKSSKAAPSPSLFHKDRRRGAGPPQRNASSGRSSVLASPGLETVPEEEKRPSLDLNAGNERARPTTTQLLADQFPFPPTNPPCGVISQKNGGYIPHYPPTLPMPALAGAPLHATPSEPRTGNVQPGSNQVANRPMRQSFTVNWMNQVRAVGGAEDPFVESPRTTLSGKNSALEAERLNKEIVSSQAAKDAEDGNRSPDDAGSDTTIVLTGTDSQPKDEIQLAPEAPPPADEPPTASSRLSQAGESKSIPLDPLALPMPTSASKAYGVIPIPPTPHQTTSAIPSGRHSVFSDIMSEEYRTRASSPVTALDGLYSTLGSDIGRPTRPKRTSSIGYMPLNEGHNTPQDPDSALQNHQPDSQMNDRPSTHTSIQFYPHTYRPLSAASDTSSVARVVAMYSSTFPPLPISSPAPEHNRLRFNLLKKKKPELAPAAENVGMPATTLPFALFAHSPERSDELDVSVGDGMLVEQVFKDGWAYGWNVRTGLRGMFPLTCFGIARRDTPETTAKGIPSPSKTENVPATKHSQPSFLQRPLNGHSRFNNMPESDAGHQQTGNAPAPQPLQPGNRNESEHHPPAQNSSKTVQNSSQTAPPTTTIVKKTTLRRKVVSPPARS